MRLRLAVCLALIPAIALADDERCLDVQFTPTDGLQIVVWIETAAGAYVDTVYVTQGIGSFGLGNRPGRSDFNSGPAWPYGRRTMTFPVWSHRHGMQFPVVMFQNDTTDNPDDCLALPVGSSDYQSCGENDLSHPFDNSSVESHFCRPLLDSEPSWDSQTCPSQIYTDKGRFSATQTTGYPPRSDVVRNSSGADSPSVDQYKADNPFDAVSQPTPVGGTASHAGWPVPASLAAGDYVLWIETAKEFDTNAHYSAAAFPSPQGIPFASYGEAFRGQPSIVYSMPFTIGSSATSATTSTYAGYGDPLGGDGTVRVPDATITTDTPGSGASRLQLVADGSGMYRVRADVEVVSAAELPAAPVQFEATAVGAVSASFSFVAPGVGAQNGQVTGYEIRYRASDAMTVDNFDASTPVTIRVAPGPAGQLETFDLAGFLPQTDYWVGVRAFDSCHNPGPVTITNLTTADQTTGSVDACFVATAAYGSIMANDVELLRHFRDAMLESDVMGELGVEAYYTFGPVVAGVVGQSDTLRTSARAALAPIIARVRRLAF